MVPAGGLALSLVILGAAFGPYLPNGAGFLGVDYGFWLPNLLAGDFWHYNSPAYAMPWFNPSECGGVPLHADPQGAYLSLPQGLTFLVPPIAALQLSYAIYATGAFAGTYWLANRRFGCSRAGSLLAATLFTLNGFFAARMMVGHLSFAPFALVPAMAGCLLGPGNQRRGEWARILGFAALLAIAVQAGMAVLILPVFYGLALLAVLGALSASSGLRLPAKRALAGGALALALCAGKLAAVVALMANLPRDAYPLPGFPNILLTTWTALRCLFLWPASNMTEGLVNTVLRFELHEFDYRVGPAPLLLFAAAAWQAWRRRGAAPLSTRNRLLWEGLALLLLIPLALNTYATQWTALLKLIPILRSASSLLRWFAAYMPAAAIGAALALDYLTSTRRWQFAGAGIALTCVCLLASDRSFYGLGGVGGYDPRPIQASWHAAAKTGHNPAVRYLSVPANPDGTPDMSTNRGNMIAFGRSPLLCYDPIFGYRLEAFHQGSLHPGPVLDETRIGDRTELNLKNPACYVFPGANACKVGDTFTSAQRAEAVDFASYRPFAFHKPWWAHMADWVGILALAGTVGAAGWTLWPRRAARS